MKSASLLALMAPVHVICRATDLSPPLLPTTGNARAGPLPTPRASRPATPAPPAPPALPTPALPTPASRSAPQCGPGQRSASPSPPPPPPPAPPSGRRTSGTSSSARPGGPRGRASAPTRRGPRRPCRSSRRPTDEAWALRRPGRSRSWGIRRARRKTTGRRGKGAPAELALCSLCLWRDGASGLLHIADATLHRDGEGGGKQGEEKGGDEPMTEEEKKARICTSGAARSRD